jgi:hypothetical protein
LRHVRATHPHHIDLGRTEVSTSTLERRVEALEVSKAAGGDGGCERCRGLLITVSNVSTGRFHSARWNGEAISEGEVLERRTESRCPQCGRNIDPDQTPVIRVGGTSVSVQRTRGGGQG